MTINELEIEPDSTVRSSVRERIGHGPETASADEPPVAFRKAVASARARQVGE